MQPRGQLWFALESICRDFRECSGLSEKEALEILIVVLKNMRQELEDDLTKLNASTPPEAAS